MEAENPTPGNNLLRFLLELALGQWNVALEGDPRASAITEGLLEPEKILAGLLIDELRSLVLHKAFVNPRKRYGFVQHGLFLLDGDFLIMGLGGGSAAFLGLSEIALYRSDFTALLSVASRKEFYSAVTHGNPNAVVETRLLPLSFTGKDGVGLEADCFVVPLHYGKERFAVTLYGLKPLADLTKKGKGKNPAKKALVVQKVYDFILAHREPDFPSAHALARLFGTNEFELKRDFKKYFGTSIYQCYMQERLKRAHALIMEGDLPLYDIASQSGFEDYSGFARAYRKYYGLSPAKSRESSG